MTTRELTPIISEAHELEGKTFDFTIVGGGPPAMALSWQLAHRFPAQKILLVEQRDVLGGSGLVSQEQSRTYHPKPILSRMTKETDDWYKERGFTRALPYVFLYDDEKEFEKAKKKLDEIRGWDGGVYGEGASVLTPLELVKEFPFVEKEQIVGAMIYPGYKMDYSSGLGIMESEAKNVTYAKNCTLQNLVIKNGKVKGLATNKGLVNSPNIIMVPGPFILNLGQMAGDDELGKKMKKIFFAQRRMTFSSKIENSGKFKDQYAFIISPEGAYVRMQVKDGQGMGFYGYADKEEELITEPVVVSGLNDERAQIFPPVVYDKLGKVIPFYRDVGGRNGSWAVKPDWVGAGFYTETMDGVPVISSVENIEGLFVMSGFGHAGVMESVGAARRMTDLLDNKHLDGDEESQLNITREFREEENDLAL